MKPKRLFLFAGYNAKGKVDDALLYMTQQLNKCGDVILVMDSDVPDCELKKIKPYTIYAAAQRHGEYDFGSYKRAYIYAYQAGILKNYDILYMVNDSVYGPLYPIEPALEKMESEGTDAFAMVYNNHPKKPHLGAWFIGMRSTIFLTPWYDQFMRNITHQNCKGDVIKKYEHGFTNMLHEHHSSYDAPYRAIGRRIYNNVRKFSDSKMPFIKKLAFTRHYGRLGRQIRYALNHGDPDARNAILSAARAEYGDQYIDWLLTNNPFKIMLRSGKYFLHKLRVGGI